MNKPSVQNLIESAVQYKMISAYYVAQKDDGKSLTTPIKMQEASWYKELLEDLHSGRIRILEVTDGTAKKD